MPNGTASGSVIRIVIGWMKRFELRRQHDVHEDERQRERQHEVEAGAAEFLRGAGEAGAVVRAPC